MYLRNAQRMHQVPVFSNRGKYYVRTFDIATYLGSRQPMEFNRDINEYFSKYASPLKPDVILKGNDTAAFRDLDYDTARTTFIEIHDMREFLLRSLVETKHRLIPGNRHILITDLEALIRKGTAY